MANLRWLKTFVHIYDQEIPLLVFQGFKDVKIPIYKTSNILKMSSLTLIVCFQHTLQKQHPGG